MRIDDWMDHGLCTYQDPKWWDGIPVPRGKTVVYDFGKARAVCNQCPVRLICLDRALESGDLDVMRGGKAPAELNLLARGRKLVSA